MAMKIDRDSSRFKQIVGGKIRENLRKYVTHGEMIDIPHFRYGKNGSGGVGQGEGDVGTQLGPSDDQGDGAGQAGSDPGRHILEVEVTLDELARILGDQLELPRIEPKGQANIVEEKSRYTGIRRTGPESLRHFKRTFKEALRRQVSSREYDSAEPRVVPIREDKRYRSWKSVPLPHANAAIVYMMDVSGSMTDDQKHIVRTTAFWLETWLKSQYDGVEIRYIIHDASAKEVDEHTFYHTRESGGTRISSAYRVCQAVIDKNFPPAEWNIYCFHFSDGDNWGEDNENCLRLLREQLLPASNLFCYGQVESPYGSGEFLRALRNGIGDKEERLILAEIRNRDGIYDAIKAFLGKGK
jgi:uncharacterized protein